MREIDIFDGRFVVISPMVRRMRLGAELKALRLAAGLTHEQVAKQIRQSRMKISRIENGNIRPDVGDVLKILDVFGVDGDQWTQLAKIARDASERGWWHSIAERVGPRQVIYADLEAGAATIRDYEQNFLPGLVQTIEYTKARNRAFAALGEKNDAHTGGLEGREGRQRVLRRPDGPKYEILLDELVLRRAQVPPAVMRDQFRFLATEVSKSGRLSLRVLPIDAEIKHHGVPSSAFRLFTYPDSGDPRVAAVEMVAADEILTAPEQVDTLERHYALLKSAALSVRDSLNLLAATADNLDHEDK